MAQIARDLGMPERVLSRWRHELHEQPEQAFPGKGHQNELEEENRRLKRELELLTQERELLKTLHVPIATPQPMKMAYTPPDESRVEGGRLACIHHGRLLARVVDRIE